MKRRIVVCPGTAITDVPDILPPKSIPAGNEISIIQWNQFSQYTAERKFGKIISIWIKFFHPLVKHVMEKRQVIPHFR